MTREMAKRRMVANLRYQEDQQSFRTFGVRVATSAANCCLGPCGGGAALRHCLLPRLHAKASSLTSSHGRAPGASRGWQFDPAPMNSLCSFAERDAVEDFSNDLRRLGDRHSGSIEKQIAVREGDVAFSYSLKFPATTDAAATRFVPGDFCPN